MSIERCWRVNNIYFIKLLLIFFVIPSTDATYNTHWIESGNKVEQVAQSSSAPLNIYCYKGNPKLIIYIWQSVVLHLDIQTDNFYQYVDYTPKDVWNSFEADRSVWTPSFFTPKKTRYLYLNPFNQTCIAVSTTQKYGLQIETKNVDEWKVSYLIIGIVLFFWARSLGENTLLYYTTGITIGICASFMILVYILSRMLPGKPIIYGSMVGGWAVGVYFFQLIWSNFQPLLIGYRTYIIWYIAIMGFLSFIVCYKRGPPKDQKSKNIIAWTLQIMGFTAIYFSTDIFEAVVTIWVLITFIKYVPTKWMKALRSYWISKFPPKRVLLTEEQYYEEGVRETAKALEELRGYCSSPECSQWTLVRKLKDPSRFADFINKGIHVNNEEEDDYDSSDFFIHRPKDKRPTPVTSTLREEDFTSDDSSFSGDEL